MLFAFCQACFRREACPIRFPGVGSVQALQSVLATVKVNCQSNPIARFGNSSGLRLSFGGEGSRCTWRRSVAFLGVYTNHAAPRCRWQPQVMDLHVWPRIPAIRICLHFAAHCGRAINSNGRAFNVYCGIDSSDSRSRVFVATENAFLQRRLGAWCALSAQQGHAKGAVRVPSSYFTCS